MKPPAGRDDAVVGPFELVAPVGQGGMGTVWRAVHRASGLHVALKFLRAEDDPEARQAFEIEVAAVAALRHPAIVHVFDYGVATSHAVGSPARGPYLAMELADGGTLGEHPSRRWGSLQRILVTLLDALAHAHARGVVHRDLKPGNILLFGGSPKLTDFGIAQRIGTRGDPIAVQGRGTPAFMAPEQCDGRLRDVGPWTDLYALGCLAWSQACGGPPFQGPSREVMIAQLSRRLPRFEPRMAVPSALEDWLRGLLEKDPSARYRRAADAAHDLLSIGSAGDGDGVPPPVAHALVSTDSTEVLVAAALQAPTAGARRASRAAAPPPSTWRRLEPPALPYPVAQAGLGLFGLRVVPLAGRESERDRIWDAMVRTCRDGAPRVVVVRGAAGVGKTRLAEWVAERAHETGLATVVRGWHQPAPGPADGIQPMLARHLGTPGLSHPEVLERLLASLPSLTQDEAAAFADLLVDPAAGRTLIAPERHALARRLLARLADERAVVVAVLDDVQWGHDAIRFLSSLVATGRDRHPILVIATVQDEALAGRPTEERALAELLSQERVALLEIGPLGPDDCALLVRNLLGLQAPLAVRVEERSAGNPSFAVMVVGDWVRRGLLVPSPGGFQLVPGAEAHLPSDVGQAWSEAVDEALSARTPAEAVALEAAAVLGHEFGADEWRTVCAAVGADPSEGLREALTRRRLWVASGTRLAFAQAMLREVLAARARDRGLAPALNAACADVLRDEPGREAAIRRGRHLAEAGRAREALAALVAGAEGWFATRDYRQVESLVLEALGLAAGLRLDWGDPWYARALELLARSARMFEEFDLGERCAAWGLEISRRCELDGLAFAFQLESAQLLRGRGREAEALARLEALLGDSEAGGDPARIARLKAAIGQALNSLGRWRDSVPYTEAALAWAESTGNRAGAAAMGYSLALAAKNGGQRDEMVRCLAEARLGYEATHSRLGVAQVVTAEGDVALAAGNTDLAARRYLDALGRYEALGRETVGIRINLAGVDLVDGRAAEARQKLELLLGPLRLGRGRSYWLTAVLVYLLPCDAALGDWPAFDAHLASASLRLAEWGFVDAALAEMAARAARTCQVAGEPDRAGRALAIAIDQYRRLDRADEVARESVDPQDHPT